MTDRSIAASTSNEIALRRVYDPAYVHRIDGAIDAAPVQVCLDARMMGVAGTGVATYADVLARCLDKAGAAAILLGAGNEGSDNGRLRRWGRAVRAGSRPVVSGHRSATASGPPVDLVSGDLFREAQVFFNLHRRPMPVACATPPTVMHWTYPVPLYFRGSRNIYTVHDVIPLAQPGLTPIATGRHRLMLERLAEHADGFLTVSEHARAAIIDSLGCGPRFVTNLSQAVNLPLQADEALPGVLRPGQYFLFCGTIEPRKNIVALARAHAASGSPRPLVIAGPDGWRADRIRAELRDLPKVLLLPWQERRTLVGLMRRARALLFPSLAEGFGLPIVEAMTLGVPVMTSTAGATQEVAGGAALLVEPRRIDAMADAIQRLCRDDRLVARLRARGFERSRHFTLDLYADRLRRFYAALVAGAEPRLTPAND